MIRCGKHRFLPIGGGIHCCFDCDAMTAEPIRVPAMHLCQMAEDHSERMQPYDGDAGDETPKF